jgi:hypothetical protein
MERSGLGSVVDALTHALGGGGTGAIADYLDADTLLHMPGGSGLAGDYQGRDAICGLLDRMLEATQGTLRFETVCTTAGSSGDLRLRGLLIGRREHHALRTTATVEARVNGDTIREARLTCSDEPTWDAFWA